MKPEDALIAKYGTGSKVGGVPCAGKQKEELSAALHDKGVQWQRISEIFAAEFGLKVGPLSLSRHYRKVCRCRR